MTYEQKEELTDAITQSMLDINGALTFYQECAVMCKHQLELLQKAQEHVDKGEEEQTKAARDEYVKSYNDYVAFIQGASGGDERAIEEEPA